MHNQGNLLNHDTRLECVVHTSSTIYVPTQRVLLTTSIAWWSHMGRTCAARVSHGGRTWVARVSHGGRTLVAHAPHLCRTCVAPVPHMCRTRRTAMLIYQLKTCNNQSVRPRIGPRKPQVCRGRNPQKIGMAVILFRTRFCLQQSNEGAFRRAQWSNK